MSRTAAVTFKGTPLTLLGEELPDGVEAPDFTLHYYDGGMQTLTLEDLKGKPSLVSIVPSLDTSTCAVQTKKFNEELGSLGDSVNALTVSLDLPFAQKRFCGAESITNMTWASDYMHRVFGHAWGVLIDELKLLARAVYVLDKDGKVVYHQIVSEVADEPDYEAALAALKGCL